MNPRWNWFQKESHCSRDEPKTNPRQAEINIWQRKWTYRIRYGFDVLYIKFLQHVFPSTSAKVQCIIPGYPKEGNHNWITIITGKMELKKVMVHSAEYWVPKPYLKSCTDSEASLIYIGVCIRNCEDIETTLSSAGHQCEPPWDMSWYSTLPDMDWRAGKLAQWQLTAQRADHVLISKGNTCFHLNRSSIFAFGLPCFRKPDPDSLNLNESDKFRCCLNIVTDTAFFSNDRARGKSVPGGREIRLTNIGHHGRQVIRTGDRELERSFWFENTRIGLHPYKP